MRAASKENGIWRTHEWVKRGILLGFRIGRTVRHLMTEASCLSSTKILFRLVD